MSQQPAYNDNVQLITYVDRLGGGRFRELAELLDGPLGGKTREARKFDALCTLLS